jgi:tetratricopeptide (TPR) repeat protein
MQNRKKQGSLAMKSISPILGLLIVFALSACSSLQLEPVSEPKLSAELPAAEMDPVATEVARLKALPNLYLQSKNRVSGDLLSSFAKALLLKQEGKLDQAEQGFRRLTEQAPSLSGPWVQLADISLLKQGESQQAMSEAVALYQRAIKLNSHNVSAHNKLATVLRKQGNFDQALLHYQQAVASWPGFAEVYLNRGILYELYLGDKAQALQQYQLYQGFQAEPERQIQGWIIDLTRQLQQEVGKQ